MRAGAGKAPTRFCRLTLIAGIVVYLVQAAVGEAWALDLMMGGALLMDRRGPSVLALEDQRVLVCGGTDEAAGSCEVWDSRTGETQHVMSLGEARSRPALAQLADGRVLIAGGRIGARGTITGDTAILDLRAKIAQRLGTLRRPPENPAALRLRDGRVLVWRRACGGRPHNQGAGSIERGDVLDVARPDLSALERRMMRTGRSSSNPV